MENWIFFVLQTQCNAIRGVLRIVKPAFSYTCIKSHKLIVKLMHDNYPIHYSLAAGGDAHVSVKSNLKLSTNLQKLK